MDANNKSKSNDEEQLLLSHKYNNQSIINSYKDNSQHQFPIEPYNQPTPKLSINHSPKVSSDSGYSGLTALPINQIEEDYIDLLFDSPTKDDTNDR